MKCAPGSLQSRRQRCNSSTHGSNGTTVLHRRQSIATSAACKRENKQSASALLHLELKQLLFLATSGQFPKKNARTRTTLSLSLPCPALLLTLSPSIPLTQRDVDTRVPLHSSLATSASIASGVVVEPKRPTTSPSREIKNLEKFHCNE